MIVNSCKQFKMGDRVKLVSMEDDPDPIPYGTEGTVVFASEVELGDEKFTQVAIDWDNKRTLMVVIPPDHIERI